MNSSLSEKLKNLKVSDYIFIIFIVISLSGIYADYKEKSELLHKDPNGKKSAHNIRLIALVASLLIYIFFLNTRIKKKNKGVSEFLNNLDILATILFIIGGIIFIYTEYKGEDESIILE